MGLMKGRPIPIITVDVSCYATGTGNFESSDGGLAMDPTHPGTQQRIDYYVNLFTNWGFDFVKLDFLSHGSFRVFTA